MATSKVNIPTDVRIQVWTEAAGRCQFNNCNKPLWYNELTLSKRNFSEMAHIIGASSNGPRGDESSEELAKDPKNIMLMCDRCHKEIDAANLQSLYPPDRLIAIMAVDVVAQIYRQSSSHIFVNVKHVHVFYTITGDSKQVI